MPASRVELGRFFDRGALPELDASAAAAALAQAADIVLTLAPDGAITNVSISVAALEQLRPEGWVGRPLTEVVTAGSRTKIEALLRDELAGLRRWRQVNHPLEAGADLPVEYALVHVAADGSRILAGRELSSVASLQQRLVAAQQSMEREYARLRAAEARYRLLFQVSEEAVLMVDSANMRIVEANPAAVELFDAKPTRLTSLSFASLLDTADVVAAERVLGSARATGNSTQGELRSAGGRSLVVAASPFSQGGRTYFLLRAHAADGTRGKPAGRSTGAAELEALLERMPEPFLVCDEAGCVLSANSAFVELTQMPQAERLRGEPLSRWLGRTDIDTAVLFEALRTHGAVRRFASVVEGEHGSSETVEVQAVAVDGPASERLYGITMRGVATDLAFTSANLERSVEQLTELVGRMPLKDIVRDATDMIERMCIEAALRLTENNRASAAEILRVSRQSLYNKMRRYEMSAHAYGSGD